ncbi:MAG: DUF1761 domain-containing protein [Phycisphaerae bacterium]
MSAYSWDVNWLAVLVSAVATFVIGGIWYAALFGKAWAALNGHDEAALAEMGKQQGRNFATFFAGDLVMATVLSVLIANSSVVTSAGPGALLGGLCWLGIAATIGLSKAFANGKPVGAWLLDTGHELVCLVTMGAILGGWR